MKITFFESSADFREWLELHHATASELWVGFYKKNSGKPSITWPESVDQALCFGWIDGVRKSIDASQLHDSLQSAQADQHLECGQYEASPGALNARA